MPVPFLRKVARIFLENEEDRLPEYCFVFPNRRSSLFFRKYLALECNRPIFSPALLTIRDFFNALSPLKEADDITLLYELYCSYKACAERFEDTFDDFLRYGDVILSDFDDIDKYLVDARGLYTNLCDLKKLDDTEYAFLTPEQRAAISDFWSSVRIGRRNSDAFVGIWKWLGPAYEDFRGRLRGKGLGYGGMIQREVAENLPNCLSNLKWKKVVFVGFNALSRCEETLMGALQKEGRGDFYWDYPGPLLRSQGNAASHFMTGNLNSFPPRYELGTDEELPLPEITVVGVPSAVGQAKAIPEILEEMGGAGSIEELSTCVVLPDSSLLHPVLNSIPESVETVNVTMGYPLKESSVAFFVSLLAQLQTGTRDRGGVISFYHVPVVKILDHPFVRKMVGEKASDMKRNIIRKNKVYVGAGDVVRDDVLLSIFTTVGRESLPKYLISVLEMMRNVATDLEKEYIYHYEACVGRMADLGVEMRTGTWFSVLSRLVASISVPLSGEPLSGLQVMGPLETMAVDFRNIVILSMNEGVFPSKSLRDSMIPYNLRRGFGLPTFEVQDAISAYHFYRGLARAEKVFFLYDTRSGRVGGSEESRYIKQLKYHHRVPLVVKTAVTSMKRTQTEPEAVTVTKDGESLGVLRGLNYSPSSLLCYLNCPLQFYFSCVRKFAPEEEVDDSVDAGSFGDWFHKTMELLHEPFEGKTVDAAAVKMMKNVCGETVKAAFKESLKMDGITGRNIINAELVRRYAMQTLEHEEKEAPLVYKKSELSCECELTTPAGNTLRIKGKVDRYDVVDGTYRIVDYKTGKKIHIDDSSIEALFSGEGEVQSTAFQLYFYLFLLRNLKWEGADTDVLMEVIHTNELFKGGKHVIAADAQKYEEYRTRLLALLDEIMNPDIPFSATEDPDHCTYCPFKILCGK